MAQRRVTRIALFCLRFLGLLIPGLLLWVVVLPLYARGIALAGTPVLSIVFRVPVEAVSVQQGGKWNGATVLTYTVNGQHFPMDVAGALSNLPPFVALVLATTGLTLRRRLRALRAGVGILAATHWTYIVLAMAFSEAIRKWPAVPTALAQLFITLPLLLWIALTYEELLRYSPGTVSVSTPSPATQQTDAARQGHS